MGYAVLKCVSPDGQSPSCVVRSLQKNKFWRWRIRVTALITQPGTQKINLYLLLIVEFFKFISIVRQRNIRRNCFAFCMIFVVVHILLLMLRHRKSGRRCRRLLWGSCYEVVRVTVNQCVAIKHCVLALTKRGMETATVGRRRYLLWHVLSGNTCGARDSPEETSIFPR